MTAEARKSSGRKSAQHQRDDFGVAQRTVYTAAKRYVAAGLSIIPIAADGTKAPCSELLPYEPARDGERPRPSWNPFRSRLPTRSELMAWFRPGHAETLCGIGVVCGVISGGLEVIDFEKSRRHSLVDTAQKNEFQASRQACIRHEPASWPSRLLPM